MFSGVEQADREHVVRPDEQREEADRDRRERDRLVAEDRLAAEDGEDLRDDPHRRQDHDVHLGMPEEPEHVLVEHGAAAAGGLEEVKRAGELALEQQHRQPGGQRRQDEQEQPRVDVDRPDEQRHPRPAHAGGAHVLDRDDEVDRAGERGEREDVEREDPQVLAVSGRLQRERRVGRPAGVGRAPLREEGQAEDEAGEEVEPVREGVEAREGHVPGADHQRHEEVAEARQDGHDDEEDHPRAVHRDGPRCRSCPSRRDWSACASCVRISSARKPETAKKTPAVAM